MRRSRESVTAAEYESADLDQSAFLVEVERFLELEAGCSEGRSLHSPSQYEKIIHRYGPRD